LPVLGTSASAQGFGGLRLGSQDCFWEEKGAFTGEVSSKMLKDFGVEYVIIGHSERRRYFNETDEMINKKIKAALSTDLKVIFCVGETLEERNLQKTEGVINSQIKNGLKALAETRSLSKLILAYEPVWAIGSGNPCPPLEAKKVGLFIRKTLGKVPLLYGGSVKAGNAVSYLKEGGFQGFLIGGASLNPEEFIRLVYNVSKA